MVVTRTSSKQSTSKRPASKRPASKAKRPASRRPVRQLGEYETLVPSGMSRDFGAHIKSRSPGQRPPTRFELIVRDTAPVKGLIKLSPVLSEAKAAELPPLPGDWKYVSQRPRWNQRAGTYVVKIQVEKKPEYAKSNPKLYAALKPYLRPKLARTLFWNLKPPEVVELLRAEMLDTLSRRGVINDPKQLGEWTKAFGSMDRHKDNILMQALYEKLHSAVHGKVVTSADGLTKWAAAIAKGTKTVQPTPNSTLRLALS